MAAAKIPTLINGKSMFNNYILCNIRKRLYLRIYILKLIIFYLTRPIITFDYSADILKSINLIMCLPNSLILNKLHSIQF